MAKTTYPDGTPRRNTLYEDGIELRIAWYRLCVDFWKALGWRSMAVHCNQRVWEEIKRLHKFRDELFN